MKNRTIVFLSYPCGGKDKHSKLLIDVFKEKSEPVLYINIGEILRNLKKSTLKNKLNQTINMGLLVPNYIIEPIVGNMILNKLSNNKHIILNGFPRTITQARFLIKMINFFDRKIDVIFLKITQKEALKRIRRKKYRNRSDDNINIIKKRFRIFKKEEISLIPFLKSNSNFITIDGNDNPINVHQKIKDSLNIN